MSVHGIGSGSPSALYALRLALRRTQPGGGAAGPGAAAAEAGGATPEALLQDIVGRAQFLASVRAAAAAVEQVGTLLATFDGAAESRA